MIHDDFFYAPVLAKGAKAKGSASYMIDYPVHCVYSYPPPNNLLYSLFFRFIGRDANENLERETMY